jgi:hypothetical protein
MSAEKREKMLGLSVKTWDRIELLSLGIVVAVSGRGVLEGVGKNGLFGYGKSNKLVKYSRMGLKTSTWKDVNTLSAILGFAVLLKSGVDLVERKTDLLKKEVSPGEGLLPRWKYVYRP